MTRENPLRPLEVVWAAMVGGTVTYTALLYGLVRTGVIELAVFGPEVMNLVGGLVILQLVGASLLRRRLVARIPELTTPQERLARYSNVAIVSLALMEGGGLIVITFAMLAGAPTWILAGGGAAAVVMLSARPSADELER